MATSGESSSPTNKVLPAQERRHVLPKDLPNALTHLDDEELGRLLTAAVAEAKRRGNSLPSAQPSRTRPRGEFTASLTRGQLNAVRAAFKAGVTPARIARQFGLSHSDVRKSSGERGIGARKYRLIRSQAVRWRDPNAAKLSYGSGTLYSCDVGLFVGACRFTCRGENREEQVRDGTDCETRSCSHRAHSNQSKRLSRRCAGS